MEASSIMLSQDTRQRVRHACDSCKRKKKQCSGNHPCAACTIRSRSCVFSNSSSSTNDHQRAAAGGMYQKSQKRNFRSFELSETDNNVFTNTSNSDNTLKTSATDDETPIQNVGRLLQDGGGRLLYIGDSAALSFLQSIRRLVEGSLGSSPFTTDVNRHKIVEASISTPPGYRHTYTLPDLEAALYLVASFFNNTTGLFDIFNREAFTAKLLNTYRQPLDADSQWLCQLNLVFAVGMQLRQGNPSPLSAEGKILEKLEAGGVKRAEIFFLTAKHLKDPVCGLEDGDFVAVQCLFLMTVFMLTAAKRNTAWVYLGMAVRLAYALGIHKEETLAIFDHAEQEARYKLWQSLYVMDCFLSASLGRPNAISCACVSELCSSTSLNQSRGQNASSIDLLASVNVSKITGEVLSRIYHKRKASRSIAYSLSLQFSDWMKELPVELHWRQISLDRGNPELTLKRLHINLIYFHGITLLTRPFLLHEISSQLKRTTNHSAQSTLKEQEQNGQGQTEKHLFCFHGACIRSAIHTITAIYTVYVSETLPRRDPFVIYWLFSATLIVLANAFCCVYNEHDSDTAICMALKVFQFCAEGDAQARRYCTILESFNDTVQVNLRAKLSSSKIPDNWSIFNVLFGGEGAQIGVEPAPPQNRLPRDLTKIWTVGDMELKGTEGLPLTKETESIITARNGEAVEIVPWSLPLSGFANDPIDFDSIWWSGGQDNYVLTDDVQVPLYGLMEPN